MTQRGPEAGDEVPARHQPGRPPDAALLGRLGVEIEPALLELALTHRSFAYENGGLPTNERLEFLGDSVLGVVVTSSLYRDNPDLPEGRLAKLRAAVVSSKALALVGRDLGLGDHILLGRGEEATGGRDRSSIVADTVEALIGAVYLDSGLAVASDLVHRLFDPLMASSVALGAGLDWKTSLQELCASGSLGAPEYVVDDSGPDHHKSFRARVRVAGILYGNGRGPSKKDAEQLAAAVAYEALVAERAVDSEPAAEDVRAIVPGSSVSD